MKRIISARKAFYILISCLLCIAVSVTGSSLAFAEGCVVGRTEAGYASVYAYGDYDITLRNAVFVSGGEDDGKILTDRKYTSVQLDDEEIITDGWVLIKSYNDESDYRVTITVSLGAAAKDISLFYLRVFHCPEIKATAPQSVKFYISSDGRNFELVGEGSTTTDLNVDAVSAVYRLNTDEGYNARYVRAVLDCGYDGVLYINELGAAATGEVFRANSDGSGRFCDEQGVEYIIEDGVARAVGIVTASSGNGGKISPSSASFDENGLKYTLGKGSDNEIEVISDFIGEGRPNYSGVPNTDINYIVIHNTGTTESDTDAERYNHRMHSTAGETSWHYTVDSNIIYHSLSDNIVGWHAGATHNYESLGIEICTNGAPKRSSGAFIFSGERYDKWLDTTFRPALKNAAMLTAELLTRYGLSTDRVIQHYDVTEKNCPLWLRYKDGKYVYEGTLWVEFMGYVEEYYRLLNGDSPSPKISPKRNIRLPDYIATSDGKVYPLVAIDGGAFADTGEFLRTLYIGKTVADIGENSFSGCDMLKITVDKANESYYSDASGALYNSDGRIAFDASAEIPLPPEPKEDCRLDLREIDGKYYLFLRNEGYTLDNLAEEYGIVDYRAVDINRNTIDGNDTVGTGTVIYFGQSRLYAVMRGDMNGDATVDEFDCLVLKSSYLGKYSPSKSQLFAGALSDGQTLSPFDYLMLKSHVFGKYDIYS